MNAYLLHKLLKCNWFVKSHHEEKPDIYPCGLMLSEA